MDYIVKFVCVFLMCGTTVLGQDITPEYPVDFTNIPTITELPTTASTTTTTTTELPITASTTTTTTELPTTTTTATKLPTTTVVETTTTTTELPTTVSTTKSCPPKPTSTKRYSPIDSNPWTPCYDKQYGRLSKRRLPCGEFTYMLIHTCYRCCYQGSNGCFKLNDGPCKSQCVYSYPFLKFK